MEPPLAQGSPRAWLPETGSLAAGQPEEPGRAARLIHLPIPPPGVCSLGMASSLGLARIGSICWFADSASVSRRFWMTRQAPGVRRQLSGCRECRGGAGLGMGHKHCTE